MSLKITVLGEKNKKVDAFSFLDGYDPKYGLLSQVIRCELLNLRGGNAHTKNRGEVRGGGKKPWRQKGTGRARHGSTRSPIWVGGGLAFGPTNERNWYRKINKSSRVSALKTIFKDRLAEEVVYQFSEDFSYPKTSEALVVLSKVTEKPKNSLVVYTTEEKEMVRGFLNTDVEMTNANQLRIHKLANAKNYILTPKAREAIETRLNDGKEEGPKKEVKAKEVKTEETRKPKKNTNTTKAKKAEEKK
jgi:large subunit ribosomal protein L4